MAGWVGGRAALKTFMEKVSRADRLAPVVLLLGLSVWLWPIGVGGRMPTGGDVTQFSMGLMAVLGEALRAGRLPLWNDLWGYGFPGLAESQMGVFYPPHLVLYGLLSVEAAYTASLVLHTFWGGLGAYWAARRFGISPVGAALAGFAWSASGFYVIHLPHQWGYTTGSWMPWAWGLAWSIASGQGVVGLSEGEPLTRPAGTLSRGERGESAKRPSSGGATWRTPFYWRWC